jgi:hypothetical protein
MGDMTKKQKISGEFSDLSLEQSESKVRLPKIKSPVDLSTLVAEAQELKHRLFKFNISIGEVEADDFEEGKYLVQITSTMTTNMGGAKDGTVISQVAHLDSKVTISGELESSPTEELLNKLTSNPTGDLSVDAYFDACRWYVRVQQIIEQYFDKGADGKPYTGTIFNVGVMGYAKLFSKGAESSINEDVMDFTAHKNVADQFLSGAEDMRLAGMSSEAFVRSLIRSMVEGTSNIRLLSIATGIPMPVLESFKS